MLCHVEDAIPEHRVEVLGPCARYADVEQLFGSGSRRRRSLEQLGCVGLVRPVDGDHSLQDTIVSAASESTSTLERSGINNMERWHRSHG